MRSIENKDAKDRLYQDDMIDTYMKKYTRLAKQMSADYKRHAINAYITEMFCDGDDKHGAPSKHQELIERATYGDQGWHHIRDYLLKMNEKKYKNLNTSAPFSIRKAS